MQILSFFEPIFGIEVKLYELKGHEKVDEAWNFMVVQVVWLCPCSSFDNYRVENGEDWADKKRVVFDLYYKSSKMTGLHGKNWSRKVGCVWPWEEWRKHMIVQGQLCFSWKRRRYGKVGPICKRYSTCLGNFANLGGSEDLFTFINVNSVPKKKKTQKNHG